MTHIPSLIQAEIMRTGPVRARTVRDRSHLAAMLRTRRALREAQRAGAARDA
jgi:hypothetical protein